MRTVANLLEVPVADIAHVLSINMLSAFTPAELLAAAKRPDIDAATREGICKRLALVGGYSECQEVQTLYPAAVPFKLPAAITWDSAANK